MKERINSRTQLRNSISPKNVNEALVHVIRTTGGRRFEKKVEAL